MASLSLGAAVTNTDITATVATTLVEDEAAMVVALEKLSPSEQLDLAELLHKLNGHPIDERKQREHALMREIIARKDGQVQ